MKSIVVTVLFALPPVALGADKSADTSFYKKAAEGGISEVEQGKLAQEKSNDPAVKEFGAMMIKDHSVANDRLKSLAASKEGHRSTHDIQCRPNGYQSEARSIVRRDI
jgi:predicted outer membrane protein